MVYRIISFLRKAYTDARGSVTLEASIIMPAVLLILFSLIFFSMYIYQQLVVLDAAVYTARQRAATWDSSYKNLEDGYNSSGGDDGLYWRTFEDAGGTGGNQSAVDTGGSPLVMNKVQAARNFINRQLSGSLLDPQDTEIIVSYDNSLIRRLVQVYIRQEISIPFGWLLDILGGTISVRAVADVVEPVEYIRNIDMAVRYTGPLLSKLKEYLDLFNTDGRGRPGKVVASAATGNGQQVRVYHYPDCKYVKRIKPENLIEFTTVGEAAGSGYYLCADCAKRAAR